jgi:hypothetical protein
MNYHWHPKCHSETNIPPLLVVNNEPPRGVSELVVQEKVEELDSSMANLLAPDVVNAIQQLPHETDQRTVPRGQLPRLSLTIRRVERVVRGAVRLSAS